MRTVLTVPVYDQREELPLVLDELAAGVASERVLIVNNGSRDGSADLIHASGWDYVDLPRNRGIGHALMTAADWALSRDFDVLAIIAGNGKMLPRELPRVLAPLEDGSADYVTGSRFLEGGDSPNLRAFRRAAIPAVNRMVEVITGAKVTDATCGYCAFRLDLLKRARFDWRAAWLDTYGFEYYLRAKVILDGSIAWREVPVTMRYPPRGKRFSKIKPVIGWYQMLRPWLIARFDSLGFAPKRGET